MKKNFTIAEFWIILWVLVNIYEAINSFSMIKDNNIYYLLGASYLVQAISLFILYRKKKDLYFYIYCFAYIINLILVITNQTKITLVWVIGYIIGTVINIYIMFIAKKSIQGMGEKVI